MSRGRRKPVTMVMATKLLLGHLWSGLNYYDYYVSEHRPNPQPPFKFTLRHFSYWLLGILQYSHASVC